MKRLALFFCTTALILLASPALAGDSGVTVTSTSKGFTVGDTDVELKISAGSSWADRREQVKAAVLSQVRASQTWPMFLAICPKAPKRKLKMSLSVSHTKAPSGGSACTRAHCFLETVRPRVSDRPSGGSAQFLHRDGPVVKKSELLALGEKKLIPGAVEKAGFWLLNALLSQKLGRKVAKSEAWAAKAKAMIPIIRDNPFGVVRESAVFAVPPHKSIIPVVAGVLDDKWAEVRRKAAAKLGSDHFAGTLPQTAITRISERIAVDESSQVRGACVESLKKILARDSRLCTAEIRANLKRALRTTPAKARVYKEIEVLLLWYGPAVKAKAKPTPGT
jgi:hypothetical protein